MPAPAPVNETINFSLSEFNEETFGKLSENLRLTIAKSPEYSEATKPKDAAQEAQMIDDEIPF